MSCILHLAALPFPTHQGTQVYIRQMCDQQSATHEVHLVTYAHGLDGRTPFCFAHHRTSDFPRYRSLRSGPAWQKPLLDIGLARTTLGLLARVRPHLIHAHHYEGLTAALASRPAVPVIYHAHTLLEPELPTYFSNAIARAGATVSGLAADRILPQMADHCIAISLYLREALVAHGIDPEKVTYVPPALNRETHSDERSRPSDKATLVYLGNLDRYQGIESMLRCFARVREHHPEARLRIVTDSDPSRCMSLATSLGIEGGLGVEPHGDWDTVLPRLLAARVAMVPRRIPGGFPIKLINYLHAGVPVVASTHGSGGLRHGVEAMVYSTPTEFVEHTCALLENDDLARRTGDGGRSFADTHFSWKVSLERLDTVYERLLRLRPGFIRNRRRTGTPAKSNESRRRFSR